MEKIHIDLRLRVRIDKRTGRAIKKYQMRIWFKVKHRNPSIKSKRKLAEIEQSWKNMIEARLQNLIHIHTHRG